MKLLIENSQKAIKSCLMMLQRCSSVGIASFKGSHVGATPQIVRVKATGQGGKKKSHPARSTEVRAKHANWENEASEEQLFFVKTFPNFTNSASSKIPTGLRRLKSKRVKRGSFKSQGHLIQRVVRKNRLQVTCLRECLIMKAIHNLETFFYKSEIFRAVQSKRRQRKQVSEAGRQAWNSLRSIDLLIYWTIYFEKHVMNLKLNIM